MGGPLRATGRARRRVGRDEGGSHLRNDLDRDGSGANGDHDDPHRVRHACRPGRPWARGELGAPRRQHHGADGGADRPDRQGAGDFQGGSPASDADRCAVQSGGAIARPHLARRRGCRPEAGVAGSVATGANCRGIRCSLLDHGKRTVGRISSSRRLRLRSPTARAWPSSACNTGCRGCSAPGTTW